MPAILASFNLSFKDGLCWYAICLFPIANFEDDILAIS